jgi:hypothetical protein
VIAEIRRELGEGALATAVAKELEETIPVLDKVRQLYTLKAVGINTA